MTAGGVTYTGKAQTPDVTVSSGGKILEADKDYTVAYKDNTDAGPATVKAVNLKKKPFTVKPKKSSAAILQKPGFLTGWSL